MKDQDSLSVFSEEPEIGFPVSRLGAVLGLRGAIVNRHAVPEVQHRASCAGAQATAAGFAARQEAVPVILLGGAVVDEAVDGLVRDHRVAVETPQATGDLLGRPALLEVATHRGPQDGRGSELVGSAALPAPLGERLGARRRVTALPSLGWKAVAPKFPGTHGAATAVCLRRLWVEVSLGIGPRSKPVG